MFEFLYQVISGIGAFIIFLIVALVLMILMVLALTMSISLAILF